MKKILFTLAIAIIGGFISLGASNLINSNKDFNIKNSKQEFPTTSIKQSMGNNLPVIGPDFTKAAEMSIHAVVHIKTEYTQKNAYYDDFFNFNDPFYQFFWGTPRERFNTPQQVKAAGSGVIISEDGYIVTNNHVVAEAEKIEVTLNDKRTYTATLVGTDPTTDLALIKIEGENFPYMHFGNSDSVKIGEWVLAVGNPFNLTSTVTAGIISAKARKLNILGGESSIESFLQTDAAVNPGNSGGALVNIDGDLIGINAAIATNTGAYAGYSFAIPVNIVKKVVSDLKNYKVVQRAVLGVMVTEIDSKNAKDNNPESLKGVKVAEIIENSAAEKSGIKIGDVITKINDIEINSSSELQERISYYSPGDVVKVEIVRNGSSFSESITLRNRYGNENEVKTDVGITDNTLGATFEIPEKKELLKLRLDFGVKVKSLTDGKLKGAGIKTGFIITHIDKKAVKTVQDINSTLINKKGGILIEGVYPNGIRAYYGFGL